MVRGIMIGLALQTVLATAALAQNPPGETATPVRPRFATLAPIFFPFNSIAISDSARSALLEAAEILAANPTAEIILIGHADERGTDAYNMRLGQHRSAAVASFLVSQGVAQSRLKTTSAGERQPLRAGHDEVSWAQNRRVEFRVKNNVPLHLPRP